MTRENFIKLSKEEKKEAKAELYNKVKEAIKDNGEATEAMTILRPSLYGSVRIGSAGGVGKHIEFAGMFNKKNDTVEELALFQSLKVGRKEVRELNKKQLKKAILKDRKWISFDPAEGIYKLEAIGANPPKNWTGYVPIEEMEPEDDEELL